MGWPLGTGLIGAPTSEEVLDALLRLQGEGAYPTDPDSVRVGELAAWAEVWGVTLETVYAFLCNVFPSTSVEMLAEWERALHILDDADRTIEERQARASALLAFPCEQSVDELTRVLSFFETDVTLEATRLARTLADGSSPEATLQRSLALGSPTQRNMRELAWVARRALSALTYGQMGRTNSDAMVTDGTDAVWLSSTNAAGKSRIGSTAGNGGTGRQDARFRDYGYLSRIDAFDWNGMQRRALIGAANGSTSTLSIAGSMERRIFFACSLAGAATSTIHTGFDARYRLGRVSFVVSSNDIRPGHAHEDELNALGASQYHRLIYTGAGGGSYYTSDSSIVFSSSGAGALQVHNDAGGTLYVVGYIELTDDVRSGTKGEPCPFLLTTGENFEDTLNSANWLALRAALAANAANGTNMEAWSAFPKVSGVNGYGGLVRTFALAVMPPCDGSPILSPAYVVDASIDWRDRIVHVEFAISIKDFYAPSFPGAPDDIALNSLGSVRIGYTRNGLAPDTLDATLFPEHIACKADIPSPGDGGVTERFRLFARASDGALMVQTISQTRWFSALVMVHVSDQLGVYRGTTIASPATPTNGDPIEPRHLNYIQDVSCAVQTRAKPIDGDTSLEVAIDALPLGLRTKGKPPIAQTYRRKQRNGIVRSSIAVGPFTDEVRQHCVGRQRRAFACTFMATSTFVTLDSSIDWRDRLITVTYAKKIVTVPGTNFVPGGANDADINLANLQCAFYSSTAGGGLPSSGGDGVSFAVDPTSGALLLQNGSGDSLSIVGVVEASFALGYRSDPYAFVGGGPALSLGG